MQYTSTKRHNFSNLQNLTNFIQVSPQLEHIPFFLQRVNIPGLNSSPEQINTRGGNRFHVGQDTLEFNPLSIEMLIDEDLLIWLELQEFLRGKIRKDGTFDVTPFDFIITINNNKGNKLFNIVYEDCRITSLSDIQLDTTSTQQHHTLSLELQYDRYDIVLPQDENKSPLQKWFLSSKSELI